MGRSSRPASSEPAPSWRVRREIFEKLMAVLIGVGLSMITLSARAEIASFYGDELAGQPMAWGEPYRPDRFTCAHRTFPRGALLELTFGDQMALCRVTDRGPYAPGRDIDVSRAVASELGLIEAGVGEVTIVQLQRPRTIRR